jgi:hypothetical protein
VLLHGGTVVPSYAAAARLQTLDAAPSSAATARLDPLDASPPSATAACLRCDAAAPPSVPATSLGRLDAATPVVVVALHRGNLDAGHLDVEASVRADEGDGQELKCIGVGELKDIDDLGRPILVFITLTGPFGFFAAASHSRTFSATPETEKGVSQLQRGGVPC